MSCTCGEVISSVDGHTIRGGTGDTDDRGGTGAEIDWEALEREVFDSVEMRERAIDRERAETFRREADRIVSLILHSDMPRIDIEIEIRAFRSRVLAAFPDKEFLFISLYLARFRRIWNQFRDEGDELMAGDR